MNIYKRKNYWKFLLFLGAAAIGLGSLWYTNKLVKDLANEEQKKIKIWAEATSLIANPNIKLDDNSVLNFLSDIIKGNETVPVILADTTGHIYEHRNLNVEKSQKPAYLKKKLHEMKSENPSIPVAYSDKGQVLYYDRSIILEKLIYYPYIQLAVILLFILIAYFAFSSSRKAEQNQVWVGLSKETAHQLGTPISSLLAWMEIIKDQPADRELISELGKDVNRLHTITERFSKIGSKPVLSMNDLNKTIMSTIAYLKTRSSDKIKFDIQSKENSLFVLFNPPLFEWVLENVCKNAMDAIEGEGVIRLTMEKTEKHVVIDITDNGKGIPKSKQRTIFKPGYTTKERGWGLGLSLTKRIIQEYHKGKIFVAESEIGKGTTIRIMMKTHPRNEAS
ncbi:MAG: GHKL domain-containing protein [Bacteroidales bacterium]|nr:GHKL domain-containing protein [Bacteroidales bacterium]